MRGLQRSASVLRSRLDCTSITTTMTVSLKRKFRQLGKSKKWCFYCSKTPRHGYMCIECRGHLFTGGRVTRVEVLKFCRRIILAEQSPCGVLVGDLHRELKRYGAFHMCRI